MDFTPQQQTFLLDAARRTIRQRLLRQEPPKVVADDPALQQPASCFVTLHSCEGHRLRGCIGQIRATGPLLESVMKMADAVLDDPRFRAAPVTADEMPELEIEITVLSPLEPAADLLDFDLLRHGVYLQCQGETGVFLPQVARETGWTKEQLLSRLCSEKMGLPANAWKVLDAKLYRFTAVIIGPEPFVRA